MIVPLVGLMFDFGDGQADVVDGMKDNVVVKVRLVSRVGTATFKRRPRRRCRVLELLRRHGLLVSLTVGNQASRTMAASDARMVGCCDASCLGRQRSQAQIILARTNDVAVAPGRSQLKPANCTKPIRRAYNWLKASVWEHRKGEISDLANFIPFNSRTGN